MRLWAEVFDPNQAKVGEAYALTGASVSSALDTAGTFSLRCPASADQTVDLLAQLRRVRIWVEQDGAVRALGSGTIRERSVDESESGATVTVTGPDAMDDLTRKSTLIKREYTSTSISTIATRLVNLVPGWSIEVDSGLGSTTMRFDGVSVLKALIRVAEENGLHLRLGTSPNTLEMGAFGDDNGLIALKPGSITHDLDEADNVVLVNNLKQKQVSRDLVNWIIPVGDGDIDTALDLSGSSHSVAHILGPDGVRQLYYLSDQDSIDAYGQIEKVLRFKEVVTADALYAAASAKLARLSVPLETYSMSVRKNRASIRPGDQMQVKYKGRVPTVAGYFTYINLNDFFWVLKVTQDVSDTGVSTNLDIATIDRYNTSMAEIVVSALEDIKTL